MPSTALAKRPVRLRVVALRELRLSRVLTQKELAQAAGVSKKTVNDVERFKIRPHPQTLRKIARALGVEPGQLAEHLERREPLERPQPQLFPIEQEQRPRR